MLRFTMMPVAMLFRKPPPENKTRDNLLGLTGRVTTSEVTNTFGQLEIKHADEPEIILNVRTRGSETLVRDDLAKIISFNRDNGTFFVELTKLENNFDE
jgi:hypothetical protein